MKKCLIIINKNAGSSKKISFDKVQNVLGGDFCYDHCTLPCNQSVDLNGYDAVCVCGGDGTLGSILQIASDMPVKVFYFPVGTLNDKAKAERYSHLKQKSALDCSKTAKNSRKNSIENCKNNAMPIVVGKCGKKGEQNGDTIFSYVFAAGSFTPIGYTSDVKEKQKFGALAYVAKVFKEYRPHRINITLDVDGNKIEGEFSLVMFVKSPRCFGFRFNKAYDKQSESGHLLLIRSPKHKGALGYIEMFFPFFRSFFVGLKKERDKGSIIFKKVKRVNMQIQAPLTFCKDGEKHTLEKGDYHLSFEKTVCDFCVIDKF